MEKQVNYTENDKIIVSTLKGASDGMTIAEVNAATGLSLVSGSFTSAKKKGLIEVIGEREVVRQAKRKIGTYNFVTVAALNDADGKEYNYTDGEKAILTVASQIETPFTLADLSAAMGKKLSSGNINGLLKKGNFTKGDQVEVIVPSKASVNVYGWTGLEIE